ncbi:hypothetical protein KM1_000210 [Entamoeba histolytica HM-3:IMSS]|uniref:Uncharacterized protein n=6 Tax=Entamoeba histolytica TaxID=5759 RepID=C4LSM4_ENTH1|nr:hypothetical protein EHI_151840 [Entamoeba histolytica HM-1:IMSS]EMD46622.1 Hypothetical protein EHI5A_000210 [Entamoeba histolytica KU27]EMS17262.1 hypothetical protein KM1_000210 [Entamoeba histolytica HM-3:IMSS]ENY59900.1 hypothetical protein EHI7A_000211 [Entamoeba histolytica HM-1:IMSS-A]GAT91433.1 hypothetical protein CL6EHI_151840 [Entamoeba histolytica]EAL52009.1 hypothetical protein EHI_151840 [Entamoeba histolytica HM-1:IMSS]|eukprot:XP_657395.1 hypothetical protein EHI_151840 [Entamoeba histolytica HM-1:IMSS]
MSFSSNSESWHSFSNSTPISGIQSKTTSPKGKSIKPTTLSSLTKEKFICKDIYKHWGLIWYTYHRTLKIKMKEAFTNVSWKYNRTTTISSQYVSRIVLTTQPDHSTKKIDIGWESKTPNRHSAMELIKFGMNQYFRLLSLNNSIRKSKSMAKTTYIPTRFLFCYGTCQFNGTEVEDVVFSIHFPFFIEKVGGSRASLILTYSIEKTLVSLTFPKPELLPIENYLPQQTISKQFKDDISFISSAISAHQQTYTTICITSNSKCASAFMNLFEPFNTPIHMGHYYPMFFYPVVLEKPIPLFSIVFTPEIPVESYINFPFPFCIIDPSRRSVQICSALSLPTHFHNRAHELIQWMIQTQKLDKLSVIKIRKVQTSNYQSIVKNARLSNYVMSHISSFFSLSLKQRKMLLLRFSEELGMRGNIFFNSIKYGDVHLDRNCQWIRLFEEIYSCDLEGLTLILASMKLYQPILIPRILWLLQQYEEALKINFI